MFDVGFSELVVIGLVALLVLGPKRLPEVARTAGRWMAQFRRFADNVRQDFHSEINAAEFNELRKLKDDLNQAREELQDSLAADRSRGTGATAEPAEPGATLSPSPTAKPADTRTTPTPDAAPPAAVNDGHKRP